MSAARPWRMSLAALRKAAESGELFLAYQPKLDLRTGRICGVEALARWHHPRHGEISPVDFIPAAERSGLIDWFSEWALNSAIAQWAEWRAAGLEIDLAVNISALNLAHVNFPDMVARLCADRGLPPARLMLEVTEGATQESTRLMDTISRFRLKGIGMSLDDFGTGFGSLLQLRSLPFTELKVDRAFVADLLVSGDSRAIIRGLIRMAHDLGLSVTAEGVEDEATLQLLATLGCDRAQGFLIARPMPADRLDLWMRKSASAWADRGPAAAVAAPAAAKAKGRRSAG